MRYKIFSFFILMVFVGVPVFFYWYFTTKEVASLHITTNSDAFTVQLQGKLKYTFLPLAEKTLDFSSVCQDKECTFSPLPPVEYTVIVTSSGMSPISDSIHLGVGEVKKIQYLFIPSISLTQVNSTRGEDISLSASGYTILGKMGKGKFLVSTGTILGMSFGVIDASGFNPILSFREKDTLLSLDESGEFLLATVPYSDITDIYSLDGKKHIQIPFSSENILSVSDGNEWKIKTKDGVYVYNRGEILKNPRFTDFIDISPYERIGYISYADSEKIQLSNLSENTSYFVFLNRETGESKTIPTEYKIRTCFFSLGRPRCTSEDGTIFDMQVGNNSK